MKHQLNIIIGSTRPGRAGPVFAEWLEKFAREHGKFEPVLTDIDAFKLPVLDEPHHPRLGNYQNDHTKAWSKAIDAADAFVFVAPEYNYFVSVLKMHTDIKVLIKAFKLMVYINLYNLKKLISIRKPLER